MAMEAQAASKIRGRILIVDSDLSVRDSLDKWFWSEGYQTKTAASGREALDCIQRHSFAVALIDIRVPGVDGVELQARLREADRDLEIVLMAGQASLEAALRALKRGAYDYITKPVEPEELLHRVENALERQHVRREVQRLRGELEASSPGGELIGRSPAMRRVQDAVRMVAPTDATVLIVGETGAGKEVVARAIHATGPQRRRPLEILHCGGLNEAELESELFGQEKGALPGAPERHAGKFEAAGGGTVFLDEISVISLETQADLLRVLQEKEVVRRGSDQTVKVDFRLIAATSRKLETLVKSGAFRADLYYRLHVFCIEVPPLRERKEDMAMLVCHFLRKLCRSTGRSAPQISAEAMELLTQYDWPGNVRELANAVERALIASQEPTLKPADFAWQLQAATLQGRTLEDVERAHIQRTVRETENNLSRAARVLDIDRTTLYNKLRRYGMR